MIRFLIFLYNFYTILHENIFNFNIIDRGQRQAFAEKIGHITEDRVAGGGGFTFSPDDKSRF